MSEEQRSRPVVPPKPALKALEKYDGGNTSHLAVKGGTHALSPADSAANKAVGNGALIAATLAERQGRQGHPKSSDTRNARSPIRGRSQLSLDLQRATDHTSRLESRNPLQRTASEIAARAASVSSSPARSRPNSPKRFRRSPSQDSTASRGGRLPSDADARHALLGATLSMSASPSTTTASPFSTRTGKLDFSKIPSLAQQVTSPVSTQRHAVPKPRQIVQAELDGHVSSRPDPPQPPPMRLPPSKDPQGTGAPSVPARKATVETPVSAMTPTFTLSKPQIQPHTMPQSSSRSQYASQPITIPPPTRANKGSPNTSVSPHGPESASRSPRPTMTANDLANAMVGASLASSRQGSRAASPAKYRPPPVPRRRSKSVDLLRPHLTGEKVPPLKPLPRRTMKHTLRKQSPESEEEEDPRRGRKHRIRKHPHMHNEGDRKRWRDKINESERKRYEGVWAANRGLLHEYEVGPVLSKRPQDSTQEEMVLNVVVKDIWNRSRLPQDVLEEIWDLVSPEPEYRALNREGFVVGLWLIDQRLKGRKLPVKVSASVWQSVQLVRGIKVSSKPF